mmetsp:Transcript_21169/g.40299  ORF Transcript_21169/g.40299 Transcript_21169/m.40299 type:complete len:123 (+) Transcript_21169:210-578(+)
MSYQPHSTLPLAADLEFFWEVVGDSGRISFTEDELTTDTFVKNENTLFFFPVSDLGFIDLEAGIECVVPSACLRMVGLRARCDPPLLAPCACFFPATVARSRVLYGSYSVDAVNPTRLFRAT